MDNITIICESEASEKIQMIMRQTDYTADVAREKLMTHNDDPIKVIKDYTEYVFFYPRNPNTAPLEEE